MKDLTSYFECDGAATPATVMGMGNPAAPEGDAVGSGDTFDFKKRKKKVKPGKEKQEWPSDAGQGKANEGLLDDDFGLTDDSLGLGFDKWLETYIEYLKEPGKCTEAQYNSLYTTFNVLCAELQANTKPDNVSILKACRSKVYTVITFLKKTSCLGDTRNLSRINGIEIRKFVKNPRPQAVQIAWDPKRHEQVSSRQVVRGQVFYEYGVNHPQNINMQYSEWYVVPGEVYDKILNAL